MLKSKKNNIFSKYKKEIIGVLLTLFVVFLSLSVLSYNPADKSWFFYSTKPTQITNWCGVVGANISALSIYFFGSAVYLFLIFLLFLSYILIFEKNFIQEISRVIAFVIFLTSITTLLRAFLLDFTRSYPGGLLGDFLFKLLSKYLGFAGLILLLFILVWASLIILFRISFITFFKESFKILYRAVKFLAFYFYKFLKFILIYTFNLIIRFFKFLLSKLFKKRDKKDSGKNSGENIKTPDKWESFQKLTNNFDKQDQIERFCPKNTNKSFENKELFTAMHYKVLNNLRIPFLPNTLFKENILLKKELKNFRDLKKTITYDLPDINMFQDIKYDKTDTKELEIESIKKGEKLEEKLKHFGIKGKIAAIRPGPVITLFEYKPEIDSKISKIISLEDDLAMALMAMSIRIVAPIPGRSVVGFEISNNTRQGVFLQEVLSSKTFLQDESKLPLALGVDIVGNPVIEDLVNMPHLLVAGSTGSGKSVGLNVMLTSLLCKLNPDQLKLILIDPKRLEFSPYADIPHLLFPIVTNPRSAAPVLKWLVQEMEDRYDKMAHFGVRNISEYQKLAKESQGLIQMPFIVLMVDELADLMMVAGKDIEIQIARIAQMARAAGIHMIFATQRPSVDVITGLIKVNFPSRIAFRVSSKIDSRTIIDSQGAEKLLGKGDMLYMNSGSSDLKRIHGCYISDKQVQKLASYLKEQGRAEYLNLNDIINKQAREDLNDFQDDLYPEIVEFLKTQDEISISMIQRQYRIGFNRSARIIERLELDGILAPAQGSKPRRVIR